MNARSVVLALVAGALLGFNASGQQNAFRSVTVPMTLDHNRMLVEAELLGRNGSWHKARLWVDTGNPTFFMSEALARDLGIEMPATGENFEIPPPSGVRIGGKLLDFQGVKSKVNFQPKWLFNTMQNDGNLPSTVLQQYQVVFDYPDGSVTIADPGVLQPRGERVSAAVNPGTGIVQIDAVIGTDSMSFALDNGASYSFASAELVARLAKKHPEWPQCTGAFGCANIWGWWPQEESWLVTRVSEIRSGSILLKNVGLVAAPDFWGNGLSLGTWYSKKAARPVVGFLGPNALKPFRVHIDYAHSAVYFERHGHNELNDMDLVGLTLKPEADGRYRVIGVASSAGKPVPDSIHVGDILIMVGNLKVTGATMGTVVDALRGKPGDTRILLLEREGRRFRIEAVVVRFL